MTTQILRDAAGHPYAFIDHYPGGDQSIRTIDGVIGRYYAGMNYTMDLRRGTVIAKGNALQSLVSPRIY